MPRLEFLYLQNELSSKRLFFLNTSPRIPLSTKWAILNSTGFKKSTSPRIPLPTKWTILKSTEFIANHCKLRRL